MVHLVEILDRGRQGPVYPIYQYHDCWWQSDTRSQDISSNGIDIINPEYSGRVKSLDYLWGQFSTSFNSFFNFNYNLKNFLVWYGFLVFRWNRTVWDLIFFSKMMNKTTKKTQTPLNFLRTSLCLHKTRWPLQRNVYLIPWHWDPVQDILIFSVWQGIIPGMRPANERWRYTVTPSLIGWVHTQNNIYHGIQ